MRHPIVELTTKLPLSVVVKDSVVRCKHTQAACIGYRVDYILTDRETEWQIDLTFSTIKLKGVSIN